MHLTKKSQQLKVSHTSLLVSIFWGGGIKEYLPKCHFILPSMNTDS